jgi:hypothetical protein
LSGFIFFFLPTLSSSLVSLDFEKNSACFEILQNQILKTLLPIDSGPLVSNNICIHTNLKMEEDCEEHHNTTDGVVASSRTIENLFSNFTLQLADQITRQTKILRDEIRENETRLSQENDVFKMEKRTENNELQNLLQAHQQLLLSVPLHRPTSLRRFLLYLLRLLHSPLLWVVLQLRFL